MPKSSKWLAARLAITRQTVYDGLVLLAKVPTATHVPDIFTKGISSEVHFTRLREGLMGSPLGPMATAFPVEPAPVPRGGGDGGGGGGDGAAADGGALPRHRRRKIALLSAQLRASVTAFAAAYPDDLAARLALITLAPRLRDAVDRLRAGASLAETTLALVSDAGHELRTRAGDALPRLQWL